MRIRNRLTVLAASLLLAACTSPNDELATENLVAETVTVRWGTYFGMCAGYCRNDLEINGSTVRLTRRSWGRGTTLPDRVEEQPIPRSAWLDIVAKINAANISNMQDQYGCPDCADGGGEWVELQQGDKLKRVTFEYGRGPRELEAVLKELRALRQKFPAQ